jgi:RimJ/RimL family protein N-acetyltransferase
MEDSAFIVWIRNLERTKGKVGDSASNVAAQESWLAAYFERTGDYYFIIETLHGIPAGTLGIYDVAGTSAELGRLILRPDVIAALSGTLLGYDLAYNKLGLTEVRGTVVASNVAMRNFVRNFGLREIKVPQDVQIIGGKPAEIIHYRQTANDWAKARESLLPLAHAAEAKLLQWDHREIAKAIRPPWLPPP